MRSWYMPKANAVWYCAITACFETSPSRAWPRRCRAAPSARALLPPPPSPPPRALDVCVDLYVLLSKHAVELLAGQARRACSSGTTRLSLRPAGRGRLCSSPFPRCSRMREYRLERQSPMRAFLRWPMCQGLFGLTLGYSTMTFLSFGTGLSVFSRSAWLRKRLTNCVCRNGSL